MTETTVFYATLYLLAYRLSVLALGGLCIYLGYRLFPQSFPITGRGRRKAGENPAEAGTELEAAWGEGKQLTLKNAAPGTLFALFGAAISIAILAGQQPEVSFKVDPMPSASGAPASGDTAFPGTVIGMKGDDPNGLHERAWERLEAGKTEIEKAIQADPKNAELYDSLALFQFALDEPDHALENLRKAHELDPKKDSITKHLNMVERAVNQ